MQALDQLNLTPDQQAKVKTIMQQDQPGPERNRAIRAILTPMQDKELRKQLRNSGANGGRKTPR